MVFLFKVQVDRENKFMVGYFKGHKRSRVESIEKPDKKTTKKKKLSYNSSYTYTFHARNIPSIMGERSYPRLKLNSR